ncbi:MAG: rod shape-determining protein MreC [Clostridiales bacterium GWD2_32_19]|nr:MAG: rod shape-determining protein MreC [Clostridiales bacterium GWD2_32_19]
MYKNKKSHTGKYIVGVTIILIITIVITAEKANFATNITSYITTPVYGLFNGINSLIGGSFNYIVRIGTLEVDNERLLKENEKLKYDNFILNEFKEENKELRNLMEMSERNLYSVVTGAEVVGVDSSSYSKIFIIDKGRNNGVNENMVVINYDGLVGKVIEVNDLSSKVMTIADEKIAVSCMLQRSKEQVILKGANLQDNGEVCKLDYITTDTDIIEGEDIVTSNISDIYPEGIPVGKVTNIQTDSSNLVRQVYVKPNVNFKRINDVLLIKNKE